MPIGSESIYYNIRVIPFDTFDHVKPPSTDLYTPIFAVQHIVHLNVGKSCVDSTLLQVGGQSGCSIIN
ncbi:MAG: hypothetical protein IPN54_07355 [Bacteroidetes bacterium]|nr:hypothetical protein [Bacteroidota bacterium]